MRRLIHERLKEHQTCAKLKQKSDRDNKFYRSYPLNNTGCRGKYEWLDVYIGLGCHLSANNHYSSLLTSNFFNWKEVNFTLKHSKDPVKVKYNCVAYLFELCYDLMLSAASNVSESPGFETFTLK